jgi:hypothetical protein
MFNIDKTLFVGPILKIVASKVDYCQGMPSIDSVSGSGSGNVTNNSTFASEDPRARGLQELTARAALENQAAQRTAELLAAEEEAARKVRESKRDKDKKKKMEKAGNKGNFSSYRNKSFIPGASKVAAAGAGVKGEVEMTVGEDSNINSDSENDGDSGNDKNVGKRQAKPSNNKKSKAVLHSKFALADDDSEEEDD